MTWRLLGRRNFSSPLLGLVSGDLQIKLAKERWNRRQDIQFFCLFVCSYRATPAAYGGSQARGLIGAVAAASARATATRDPSWVCDLHHGSWQRRILNPLSQARDQTHNLMVPLSHDGNSKASSFINFTCTRVDREDVKLKEVVRHKGLFFFNKGKGVWALNKGSDKKIYSEH